MLLDLGLGERLEQHDVVEPVEELGPEVGAHLGRHELARVRLDLAVRADGVPDEVLRPDVGGHDDDRVAEVDGVSLRVGQPAVVQDLQHRVEDVRVRLLHLVEQHHRVRLAPHRLGELAALLVADVSGRRADQAADRVPLLVLAHVDPDHVLLGVEQGRRQRLGQLGLAHPGRPEEDERPDRPARVLDARTGPDDRVGDQPDCLVLADDPLVQDRVQPQDLLPFPLLQAADRDAGPAGHDRGDLVAGHDLAEQPGAAAPGGQPLLLGPEPPLELGELAVAQLGGPVQVVVALGLLGLAPDLLDLLAQLLHPAQRLPLGLPLGPHGVGLGAQVGQLPAQLGQPGLAGRVVLLGQRGLLDLQPHDPAGELVELGRHRVDLGPEHRAGLVDQVDRLVRQEPVGDVAMAERHGGDQGVVLDLHAVEDLEALAQAAQDRDGVLDRRLVDQDRLEPTLQCRVLLDVLAVLVQRRRADHVQLAAGQHRLEHVAGVHRALGGAGADHGVQLVDEQQDPPSRRLDLGQHGLEPLLELAAVLRAGDQRAHVEGKTVLSRRPSGTSPRMIRWARPSTIAVLPTPGSPISTGLFLVLRDRIWMTRRISASRPITGSSRPLAASATRSRPYFASAS